MIMFSSHVITASQIIVSLYALHAGALLLGFDQCGPYHNAMIGNIVRGIVFAAGVVVLFSVFGCGPAPACSI